MYMYVDNFSIFCFCLSPLYLPPQTLPYSFHILMQNHRPQSTFSQLSGLLSKTELSKSLTLAFHSGPLQSSLAWVNQSINRIKIIKNPATRSLSKPYLRAWAGPAVPFSHLRSHFRLGKSRSQSLISGWDPEREICKGEPEKISSLGVCWYFLV